MKNAAGQWGEIYAARHLRDSGYDICCANYSTRLGEIDIIAQKDGILVFAEVKTRGENAIAPPAQAVDGAKMRRIALAAAQYIRVTKRQEAVSRFDVIEVYLDREYKPIKINQIEAAFEMSIER